MSGSHLVEQSPEVSPATNATTEDQAASLRAAALLTLKSKRRRLTADSSQPVLPPRPTVAPPSITLDYGTEEPSGGVSSTASSPAMQPVTSAPPVPDQMDVVDEQAREEGEISDSDSPPPSPIMQPQPEPPSPKVAQSEQASVRMPPPPPPPPALKLEPMSPALSSAAPQSATRTVASAPSEQRFYRPGLAMTEEQYNAARDIILDLLGWGVPPEYLVNCGLSREIIFYIFVEYNLRLPSNLDVAGLMPHITSASAPSSATSTGASQRLSMEASLLSAAALPFVPNGTNASGVSTPSTSLHDIEQQRKQELLARKAAQATRKLKPQRSSSSIDSQTMSTPLASSKGDNSLSFPVPNVDDFLKSIDPAGSSSGGSNPVSTSTTSTRPPSRSFSVDAMDVDEIPGLSGGFSGTTDYTPIPRPVPPRSSSVSASSVTSPRSPVVPPSAVSTTSDRSFYGHSSVRNGGATLPYDDDMDTVPGLSKARTPPEDTQVNGARRGTKRPVAADFVDMDPGPSRVGSRGVPPDQLRGMPRRKTTGFAGIQQRRCVIDLSDTEDEPEDVASMSNGVLSRTDSRGPNGITPQVSVAPTPRVNSPATSSAAPAALLEKEEQIRRMRELIAQREQDRLRKLAAMSRRTPTLLDGRANGTVSVKQEDDDSSAVQSLQPSRSSSSATPDPSSMQRRSNGSEGRSSSAAMSAESNENTVISLPASESTSDAATPIDVTSNSLEHSATGDKVLTDEGQREQVIASPESIPEHSHDIEVDVVGMHPETSAQVTSDAMNVIIDQQSEQTPGFETYCSLLDRHPLLRANTRQEACSLDLSASSSSVSNGSFSNTTHVDIDLKPLKQAAVMQYLSDNSRQICQYELGGGECRDKNCENVHLSRISAVEPTDEDTAQYLCSSIPSGQRYGVDVFRKALDVARLSHPTMPFDARVQEALTRLGLR